MRANERQAKKSLGQHFLRDSTACRRIVELAKIETNDQVLEIGPGPGAITELIREVPKQKLLLVEKDDFYAEEHAKKAEHSPFAEEVWHGDAMQFPWRDMEGMWVIMGNLPYNVASPLMWDIVSRVPQLKRAVFMIQKEVADRILASPGNKTYGALTAWLGNYVKVKRGFNLGPGAFSPPPKVDSAVIVMTPLPPEERPTRPEQLACIIKTSFGQRRKQLNSVFRKAFPSSYSPEILEKLGIDPQARPETLSPQQFKEISMVLNI